MNRIFFIGIVILYLIMAPCILYADDAKRHYELEPIIVTPYKSPISLYNSNRSVYTVGGKDLDQASFSSIPELLSHAPGVDIQRRGMFGVQSDFSIRGANFEENLIMIDGIRLNDPQTGHHNMDIPLTINDIERIEVLKGHTSGIYGPDGFGGALNIITKKPKGSQVKGGVSFGENDFFGKMASVSFPLLKLNNRVSFENKKSDGWKDYTKFDVTTLSCHSSANFKDNDLNFHFGWKDNDFEADSFYSNLFPREEEHTDTRLFKIDGSFRPHQFRIEPKLYYRRHADKFILDKERRGWNENFHASYVYGAELLMHFDSSFGRYTIGSEIAKDKVESTNLGFHSHQREAVLLAISPKLIERFDTNASIRYDHSYRGGSEWSPSIDVGYFAIDNLKLRASFGKSFRTPSFTELYYNTPGNIGDETLDDQIAWSYEAGFSFKESASRIECDIFRRDTDDVIDWTRPNSTRPWTAQNIGEVETDGLEITTSFTPDELIKDYPLKNISFSYSCLDSDRSGAENFDSKYVLNYLRHHAVAELDYRLPFNIIGGFNLSYKDRVNHDGHFLLDSKLYKEFNYKTAKLRFFVDAKNLLNTFYTEVEDVSPPGRWVIAGVELEY